MEKFIVKKIPNGKLVKLKACFNEECIDSLKIRGDFFLYPEETILEIEKVFNKLPVTSSKEEIAEKVEIVLKKNEAKLIGVSGMDIAEILKEVLQ